MRRRRVQVEAGRNRPRGGRRTFPRRLASRSAKRRRRGLVRVALLKAIPELKLANPNFTRVPMNESPASSCPSIVPEVGE
jgi:hypothetical protein